MPKQEKQTTFCLKVVSSSTSGREWNGVYKFKNLGQELLREAYNDNHVILKIPGHKYHDNTPTLF